MARVRPPATRSTSRSRATASSRSAPAQPTGDQSPIAATSYTRAGNFSISTEGYLTTQTGQYVIGYHQPQAANPDGVAILIPQGATGVAIDQSGGVSYVDPNTNTRVTPYRITLATFSNASGLERSGGNSWITSANSGFKTDQHAGPRRHGHHDRRARSRCPTSTCRRRSRT